MIRSTRCCSVFVVCLFMWDSIVASPVAVNLPAVTFPDTEIVTNVPFQAFQPRSSQFVLNLSCMATPSNQVEIAFGTDRDADGRLAHEECELLLGWDRGGWFVQRGMEGMPVAVIGSPTNAIGNLQWSYRLTAASQPPRLSVVADGSPAFVEFAAEAPDWIYSRSWNLVRLTGRGLDDQNERFDIRLVPDAMSIFLR